jgi:hypothetical protein
MVIRPPVVAPLDQKFDDFGGFPVQIGVSDYGWRRAPWDMRKK